MAGMSVQKDGGAILSSEPERDDHDHLLRLLRDIQYSEFCQSFHERDELDERHGSGTCISGYHL